MKSAERLGEGFIDYLISLLCQFDKSSSIRADASNEVPVLKSLNLFCNSPRGYRNMFSERCLTDWSPATAEGEKNPHFTLTEMKFGTAKLTKFTFYRLVDQMNHDAELKIREACFISFGRPLFDVEIQQTMFRLAPIERSRLTPCF